MAKAKTLCNVCGKEFDMCDDYAEFGIHKQAVLWK